MQRNTVNLIGRDDLTRDFYIQRSLYRDEVQNHEYVAGVIVMIWQFGRDTKGDKLSIYISITTSSYRAGRTTRIISDLRRTCLPQ